jgi:hypothetical protein
MILMKLREALADIPAQRKALDEVEVQLRSMIAKFTGSPDFEVTTAFTATSTIAPYSTRERERDRIDEIADVIRRIGHPIHISEICQDLSDLRGARVERKSIEPGLNRHISKTKTPRIGKFGPSVYGLAEWKHGAQQPAFSRTA